jgi:methyl-accepting chemotaxis protein
MMPMALGVATAALTAQAIGAGQPALAHRTGQSTQEIEQMIAAIQSGTDSVVKATALSTQEADRTLDVAR